MKKMLLAAIVCLIMLNMKTNAQTPVYEYVVDTSIYEETYSFICPGPNALGIFQRADPTTSSLMSDFAGAVALFAYKKKNSDQYDIFSFTGKIASVTVPHEIGDFSRIFFSQFFIDNDADWECIVNYMPDDSTYLFKVLDANGTPLLSDTGRVVYGYDWQNTYVVRMPMVRKYGFKAWRFRTNVSSASPNALSKTAGSFPHAMMTYGPTGDYRITLAPAGGGKTSVQLFDMLGRNIFSKNIDNITSPVSFTIPENNVPQSPFIAKVKDEKGVSIKREIPVK